jgi:hypothetical protein
MNDQELVKAKLEHANLTVADKPYEFSTAITLTREQLGRINTTPGGVNIPISEVIDNYPQVEDRLKRVFANQYSLDDHVKSPLNFMLVNAGIYGIKSPDPYGGMTLGGTLTLPAVHAATMPTDEISPCGGHRKLLPGSKPHYFVNGFPHVFHHTLSHNNVDNQYELIENKSVLNTRLVFPNMQVEGNGGVLPSDDKALVDYVKNKNNGVFIIGHQVNENSVYPGGDRPTITEVLSADARQGGSVKSQHLIAVKNGTFPATWYNNAVDKRHIRDEGVVVPVDDFAHKTYHFIDSCNESRATNFHTAGIWWDVDHINLTNIPKITAKLKFKILPIVPYHEYGKEHIPYQNFVKHLRNEITQVDKPFKTPPVFLDRDM